MRRGANPERKGWKGDIKGPFNKEAREKAGMTPEFYENLRGEQDTDAIDAKMQELKVNEAPEPPTVALHWSNRT